MATEQAHAHDLAPAGELGRRGIVYRLLSDAGERGLVHEDFKAAGIHLWRPHVESLSLEHGIVCEFVTERVPGRAYGLRWRVRLVKDGWRRPVLTEVRLDERAE